MTSLSELKFFTTLSHECSYLPGQEAITLFADPNGVIDTQAYTALSAAGFRRSGNHIYRPHCEQCTACIPVRIPVTYFQAKRRQKRITKRNSDLRVRHTSPSVEYYSLFEKYIRERHADGDMFPASEDQYVSFLVDGRPEASFYEFILEDQIIAVAVADKLDDGLSAIYTFFDPAQDKRSLGTYAVLWLVEEARSLGLEYLYLGYWIKECQKMSYKADYQPLQAYRNNRWITQ